MTWSGNVLAGMNLNTPKKHKGERT